MKPYCGYLWHNFGDQTIRIRYYKHKKSKCNIYHLTYHRSIRIFDLLHVPHQRIPSNFLARLPSNNINIFLKACLKCDAILQLANTYTYNVLPLVPECCILVAVRYIQSTSINTDMHFISLKLLPRIHRKRLIEMVMEEERKGASSLVTLYRTCQKYCHISYHCTNKHINKCAQCLILLDGTLKWTLQRNFEKIRWSIYK